MLKDMLKGKSQASYVEYGYGQVEPNHLSAQRTAQIYAQLPADKDIEVLEQGQFVKYDYANGLVNFTGAGEWMLVFNEIKLYREGQMDCEFAMIKDNYQARVYSPFGAERDGVGQSRYYNGKDAAGNTSNAIFGAYDDVTAAPDMYELHYEEDPFKHIRHYDEKMMPEGTTMVPRVFKTNVGDIFTTNTIMADSLNVADILAPNASGILAADGDTDAMKWQVVKVYDLADGQKAVKIMRIA